jgi:hypothetical protein
MLLKGLLLARAGVPVTIFEGASEIGGSWRPQVHFGIEMDAGVLFFITIHDYQTATIKTSAL